jgi:glutamate-5-semialdehyde dehydrogenase
MTTSALDTDIYQSALDMAARASSAGRKVEHRSARDRDHALLSAAAAIESDAPEILAANFRDLQRFDAANRQDVSRDRMRLDAQGLSAVIQSIREIAAQDDPLGEPLDSWTGQSGVNIRQVRVPIGVLAVIFESRPNVAADAATLAIRSGNAVILRGGSDCRHTNHALVTAFRKGLATANYPADLVQEPPSTDRAYVGAFLTGLENRIDLVIPRGGRSLVKRVQAEARVAVLGHLDGICHAYVGVRADTDMARSLILNAKMRRTSVCNALECLLIDSQRVDDLWPLIASDLEQAGCQIRADERSRAAWPGAEPAQPSDWGCEFLDAIIAVRTVDGLDEALSHIDQFGSGHTDLVITDDDTIAERFLSRVDSAVVIANASTGLSDGAAFGFGAEIGIATSRLHARGPVGAKQLTTYKYQVRGIGQTRG